MSIAVPLYGFGANGGSPNKSTIIVTAPTGSAVTCKMGSTTKTATEKNGVWTFGGLGLGTWTITSTKGGDSATQDVAITRLTVEYVTIVYRITPEFTYTGDYEIVDDSDNPISDFASWKNNWKIRFLTSGTFTVTKLNGWDGRLDVFLVGGGGGGSSDVDGSGGGGGGYTKTVTAVSVSAGTEYAIVVGAGGKVLAAGGTTSAFTATAAGGKSASSAGDGGNGGSGGGGRPDGWGTAPGAGGSDGGNGVAGYKDGGIGQGITTREYGSAGARLYADGGSGIRPGSTGNPPQSNTGNGGNGAAAGASGIVIARNHRGGAA